MSKRIMRHIFGIALALAPLGVTPSCDGNLDELDACRDLADALCARAEQCRGDVDTSGCRAALADRCAGVDAVALEDTAGCAEDLAATCSGGVPARCAGLAASMGCDRCGPEAPEAGMVRACCEADPWSPVCGGC